MVEKIAVAIVDDAELIVAGVQALLAPFEDTIDIVSARVGRVGPTKADLALVDATGPLDAGLLRVREVLDLGTVSQVALYSWRVSDEAVQAYLSAGASGVVSKSSTAEEMQKAIQLIHEGQQVVHVFPAVVAPGCEGLAEELSERDVQILSLAAKGFDNAEIGEQLFLAESTVKTYVKRLYQTLGVHTRAQAVMRAVEMGLTPHHPGT